VSFSFNPGLGTILVVCRLTGPLGTFDVVLALDTGASRTAINTASLVRAGYDPAHYPANLLLTTGSGIVSVARVPVIAFEALGQSRPNFEVVAHSLPPTAAVDGVLGLDFFHGLILTLDFQKGEITLVPAPSASATP